MKRVVRLLRVILSVGKVEFWVCMGGMVVVGGVLEGGLGLGDTVEVLVSVLIGLLHLCRCLGVGIVVGLSEGGIVVVGGNVVVKALGGKVNVVVCMCGNVNTHFLLPYIIMDLPIFVIAEWATLLVDIRCPRGDS